MLEFFGRFHPVFVHLPIGILLLACICILLSLKQKFANLKHAIPLMLLLGALSAIVSCVTGYLLANGGDYDGNLVSNHQWMGISVAVLSIILWAIYKKVKSKGILAAIATILVVLISILAVAMVASPGRFATQNALRNPSFHVLRRFVKRPFNSRSAQP